MFKNDVLHINGKCPECFENDLVHYADHTLECTACGYQGVLPKTRTRPVWTSTGTVTNIDYLNDPYEAKGTEKIAITVRFNPSYVFEFADMMRAKADEAKADISALQMVGHEPWSIDPDTSYIDITFNQFFIDKKGRQYFISNEGLDGKFDFGHVFTEVEVGDHIKVLFEPQVRVVGEDEAGFCLNWIGVQIRHDKPNYRNLPKMMKPSVEDVYTCFHADFENHVAITKGHDAAFFTSVTIPGKEYKEYVSKVYSASYC